MAWLKETYAIEVFNVEQQMFDRYVTPTPILVLRDYENWIASVVKHIPGHGQVELNLAVDVWCSHIRAAFTVPTILYPRWFRAGHGEGIKVSSGVPMKFGEPNPMTRAQTMKRDTVFQGMLNSRPDAMELNRTINWNSC